jgi:hypothetical protein
MVSSSLKSRFSSRSYSQSKSESVSSSGYGFWILIILLIVLIIGSIMSGTFYKKYEKFTDRKSYTLQYYCMERCGHCKDFESNVWNAFSTKIQNNPGYYHFNTIKYDITDNAKGAELGEKYNITSTPTILLYNIDTGKVSNFTGDRTEAALIKFANNVIKSEHPTWTFRDN